jgi:hypothetical protein
MNRISVVAALAAMTLVGTTAFAGSKVGYLVQVDTVNRSASGTLPAVRSSADPVEYLSCSIRASGTGLIVVCEAQNASGVTGACSTSAANFVQLAGMISGDSHVSFNWNASGICTAMTVDNGSQFAPKQL